jgi:hypothetical protein
MARAKKEFNFEDSKAVMTALLDSRTDDRTVAVVAAAYIDKYLDMALATLMPGITDELKDKIFGVYGSVNTMAAKIDLSAAMNLIDDEGRRSMIAINRLRNRFAHDIHVSSFDHPEVVSLSKDIPMSENMKKMSGMFHREDHETYRELPRPRFTLAAMGFCMGLNNFVLAKQWEASHPGEVAHGPSPDKSE